MRGTLGEGRVVLPASSPRMAASMLSWASKPELREDLPVPMRS